MQYIFLVKDLNNNKYRGSMVAKSKKEVYEALINDHLFPYYIVKDYQLHFKRKIKLKQLYEFIQQWLSLEKAKIKTQECLEIIASNTSSKLLKDVLSLMLFDLSKGINLRASFIKFQNVFPKYFILHIVTGLEKGRIEKTLELLFEYYHNSYITNKKIKSVTIYPKILLIVFIIAFIIILKVIIPSFVSLYQEMNIELNAIIMNLINIIDFIFKNWILITGIITIIIILSNLLLKISKFKMFIDKIKSQIFQKYNQIYYTYLFSQTVYLLWEIGYNKFESLKILRYSIPNSYYQYKFDRIEEEVVKGLKLSESIEKNALLAPTFCRMFKISEINNFMDDNLKRASDYYRYEYQQLLNNRIKILEPVLISLIALMVLALIVLVFLPMLTSIKGVM